MSTNITQLVVVTFNRVEKINDPDGDGVYVECRLTDPPVDFAVGYGSSLSEAFADMRARVLDTAIYSARLLHDDPEEWARRAGGGTTEETSGTSETNPE